MKIRSIFHRPRLSTAPALLQARPRLEELDERALLSTISGFVYDDANNNGLFDSGERGLPGSNLQLRDTSGNIVGTAVSSANGAYAFSTDSRIDTTPLTRTVLISFDASKTGWTKTAAVAQFDPSLGQLTSVEIVNTAQLNTQMQFDNLDEDPATISGTVTGTITLTCWVTVSRSKGRVGVVPPTPVIPLPSPAAATPVLTVETAPDNNPWAKVFPYPVTLLSGDS